MTRTGEIIKLKETISIMLACINEIEGTIDYDDDALEDIQYCIKKYKIDDIQRNMEEGIYDV